MDYWLSDDHDSYNGVLPDRVKCIVHRLRQRARHDERVQALQKAGELEELRRYLQDEYEQLYEDLIEQLIAEYPVFWDEAEETFTGPVSTNAIEGGNWRVKYGLRVPYARCQAARARTALVAVRDSVSTFANGRPAESFAHRHGRFGFEQVLGKSSTWALRPPSEERLAQAAV